MTIQNNMMMIFIENDNKETIDFEMICLGLRAP